MVYTIILGCGYRSFTQYIQTRQGGSMNEHNTKFWAAWNTYFQAFLPNSPSFQLVTDDAFFGAAGNWDRLSPQAQQHFPAFGEFSIQWAKMHEFLNQASLEATGNPQSKILVILFRVSQGQLLPWIVQDSPGKYLPLD